MDTSPTLFAPRDDENGTQIRHQEFDSRSSSNLTHSPSQPPRKRRNQKPNPDDAEVIMLSPTLLMEKNRFVCEVCNIGFPRDQNLLFHIRTHNLPWKPKQKGTKEVKRKLYLCPEPTCPRHEPAQALGDLMGLKKHFSRKHREKKFQCNKCSKKYAIESDCKSHIKTCGTKHYKCDCGTIFYRCDTFTSHKTICDAPNKDASFSHHSYNHKYNPSFQSSPRRKMQLLQPFAKPQVLNHIEENQVPFGLLPPESFDHAPMQFTDQIHFDSNDNEASSSFASLLNLSFFPNNGTNNTSATDIYHYWFGEDQINLDSVNLDSPGDLMSAEDITASFINSPVHDA